MEGKFISIFFVAFSVYVLQYVIFLSRILIVIENYFSQGNNADTGSSELENVIVSTPSDQGIYNNSILQFISN